MAPNPHAQRVHDELFPDLVSTLSQTDPELIAFFDNFAFDEVLRHGSVDTKTRLMVQLAALIACQAATEFRVLLGAALTAGVTPVEAKEIVYQAVPYLGIGKVIDFLHIANAVLTERGIALPLAGQSTTTPENRAEKGLTVQKEIVGAAAIERMAQAFPQDQQHIVTYLADNCFGDIYTRTGLTASMRELITLSLLVAHGGCDGQVRGHVGANLHVGNDRARLIEIVTQLLPFIGYPRTLNAFQAINDVAKP